MVNSTLVHDLLVELDRTGAMPLHRQIEAVLRDGIRTGRLRQGASLPSSRRLATEIGVSRGVVVEAYNQLLAEGYLTSAPGSYTRVAAVPGQAAAATSPPPARTSTSGEAARGVSGALTPGTVGAAVNGYRRGNGRAVTGP